MTVGRPHHLTIEIIESICDNLRKGMGRKGAAHLAKHSYEAFNVWLRRGRIEREKRADGTSNEQESIFVQFVQMVEEAEADVERRCAETLLRAADTGDVSAARYWLGVRRRWREPQRVEVRGHVKVEFEKLSDDELDERIRALESKRTRDVSRPPGRTRTS